MRRPALIAVAVLAVGVIGYFGVSYLTYGQYIESTDDAYVKADTARRPGERLCRQGASRG